VHTQQQLHFLCPDAIDIVGTGGSWLPRINTSTLTSIILASMWHTVTKHGNNASSWRFGSFDLLQNLGYPIPESAAQLQQAHDEHGLVFQYAKKFYPVFRYAWKARTQYWKPTIFNLLGPLLNPSSCAYQLIGCSFEQHLQTIAEVCQQLWRKRVAVVRWSDGLDEVTLTWPTTVFLLNNWQIEEFEVTPEDFWCTVCDFTKIAGGNGDTNSRLAIEILQWTCTSRHLDLVCVNVVMSLYVLGVIERDEFARWYNMVKEHIVWWWVKLPIGKLLRGWLPASILCNSKILQHKRLFKACGIRGNIDDEVLSKCVDMIGINCVPSSKRYVLESSLPTILEQVPDEILTIALFQDTILEEVLRIATMYWFDGVQLHGSETLEDCERCVNQGLLVIKALPYDQIDRIDEYSMVSCFIIDAKQWGSGISYEYSQLSWLQWVPFLIAGWVSHENTARIMHDCPNCLWVDVASWIESDGSIDYDKITAIRNALEE
jgi:anthranilate phosphoribosyltransferase